ncbi:MAG TPA: tetratricopeptide repeat protein [Candidatus Polarisedimenticolaceae bacterium]|nr:tetratricopeptide repeat protein [Candidatus Polarisedimenticolaceae bacterium]
MGPFRRSPWSAAPAVAAFLVYAATLGAGFLYDDEAFLRTNRYVQDASLLVRLPAMPFLSSPAMGNTNYYRPVVGVLDNLTWHALSGRPLAFHLLSILLHMTNATLVMLLVRKTSAVLPFVAAGAGVLFAVHPLASEAVAWPSCLAELAFTAFGLGALLLHVSSWEAPAALARSRRLTACLLFGLSCGCKETAVAFLPLLFLAELWLRPGGRIGSACRAVLPWIAVVGAFFAVRFAIIGGLAGGRGMRTAAQSLWNAPGLLLRYLRWMVVPSPLLIEHVVSLARGPGAAFAIGAAVLALAGAGVLRLRRSRPDLALAAALTVVPLLPALYLPALGRDPFAERYAYLALAGFSWLVAGGVGSIAARPSGRVPAWVAPAVLYILAIAGATRTVRRCGDWIDDGTLGHASVRDEPRAAIGYLLEGGWLKAEGRHEEAWRVYRAGLDAVPTSTELPVKAVELGVELRHLSHDDVLALYERLVPLSRDSAPAQFNLGHALLEGGRLDAAHAAFARALELVPDSAPSMTALAEVTLRQGDAASAEALCRRALVLRPGDAATLAILEEAQKRAP